MLENEYEIMYNLETNYWWYVGLHELIVASFISQNKTDKKLDILDAGCGTCRLIQILSEKHNVEGFDFSDTALELCKKRKIKGIQKHDINLWTAQKNYDVIVSADVLCSVGIDDEQKILQHFYSALKPQGILVLNLPAFEILRRNHDKAVFIGKRYTKKEVKKMLNNAGFEDLFISYRLPWLFFVVFIEKIVQKILFHKKIKSDLSELPDFVNSFFLFLNRIDNFFIKKGMAMPFGTSLFVVAHKN